jgi:endoglucanase
MRIDASVALLVGLGCTVHLGCGDWDHAEPVVSETGSECSLEDLQSGADLPQVYPRGLRAAGNRIEDAEGRPIVLRGVNRSGTEYQCSKSAGIFDGPFDEASMEVMKSWSINAVRVPLNEYCWRAGVGSLERYSGCKYRRAIKEYVTLLHRYEMVPILDLHWAAPAEIVPTDLHPMPNADHSEAFWRDVAMTFLDDDGIILEPYNEPFPYHPSDNPETWACWRDGCEIPFAGSSYEAVGMQALVDAIRETGSTHLILVGGVRYSNSLSLWLDFMPADPLRNLGAAWHVYNFNACRDEACWNGAPAEVAGEVPVIATEIGQDDCAGEFITPLMNWLDERGSGYLAWSWNAGGPCEPRTRPWFLVQDYSSGQPNSDYAAAFYAHVTEAAR